MALIQSPEYLNPELDKLGFSWRRVKRVPSLPNLMLYSNALMYSCFDPPT